MILNAVRTSACLSDRLASPRTACVHSVFRRAVNILGDNVWISLHPRLVPLNPYSIGLDVDASRTSTGFLECYRGETVVIEDSCIILGKRRVTIRLGGARQVRLNLKAFTGSRRQDAGQCLRQLLLTVQSFPTESPFLRGVIALDRKSSEPAGLDDPFTRRSYSIIAGISRAWQVGSGEHLGNEVARAIGFGIGLTPSGDDFITGMLGATEFFASASPLRKIMLESVTSNIHSTTLPSYYMLRAALDGCYPEVLIRMLLAIAHDEVSMSRELKVLRTIGATSGDDMLAGIILTLKMLSTRGES